MLSHCGLDDDKRIAAEAGDNIDLIVGAHSHSFLYSNDTGAPYDAKTDVIVGEYPVVVQSNTTGKKVKHIWLGCDRIHNLCRFQSFKRWHSASTLAESRSTSMSAEI